MHNRIPVFKKSYSVILLFFCQLVASAQPGYLDSTFNGTGRAYTTVPVQYGSMFGTVSVIQPDGKLLAAGSRSVGSSFDITDCVILRYNENGSIDSSFGTAGSATVDFGNDKEGFSSLALQQDGKIIAIGTVSNNMNTYSKGMMARFKANGGLDSSFGLNGKIVTDYFGSRIKLLNNGKILIPGSGVMAKYYSNGTLDSSFGVNGILNTSRFNSYEMDFDFQDDGKIISAGYLQNAVNSNITDFEVTRYLSNGQLDPGFNGVGYVNTFIDTWGGLARAVKVQPDEKILVAGIVKKLNHYEGHSWVTSDGVLIRYLKNGMIDSSFGTNGKVTYDISYHDIPSKIALQSDGKILLSGIWGSYYNLNEGTFALARFLPNGSLDSTFGLNGINIYHSSTYGTQGNYGLVLRNSRIYLSGWADHNSNHTIGFYTLAIKNDGMPFTPNSVNVCMGNGNTDLTSDLAGSSYQWQLRTDGVVFSDLSNNGTYTGTNTSTLTVNNIPSSWYGYQFRCVVDNGVSSIFTILVSNVWTGSVSSVWENPANWSCGSLPDSFTDVVINSGTVTINSNVTVRSLTLGSGATLTVGTGFNLTVLH